MLRAIAAIGLIGLLFSNVFLKSFVFLDFKIHQQLISQTICVQKDTKMNTCNGKCHLAKQLKKSEEGSKKMPALPSQLEEVLLFFTQTSDFELRQFENETRLVPNISNLHGADIPSSIFHPPPVV
ncbi:MAG: hypothetical protein GC178_01100 [Flavobacteriales bacterium]|nr:hypothetical protein [Flavobacteriales bacterium]